MGDEKTVGVGLFGERQLKKAVRKGERLQGLKNSGQKSWD